MTDEPKKLVTRIGDRFGVESEKLLHTLKATAFANGDSAPSNEQMMALLVVCDQYGLNPFTREIFAFPDKRGAITPVVSVDGWIRIINSHPAFDGVSFAESTDTTTFDGVLLPDWVECTIYRKDRAHPTTIREYTAELYRPPVVRRTKEGKDYTVSGPWQTHGHRLLRHKALIQCARVAFGFAGIYDEDEAVRIVEAQAPPVGKPIVQMPQAIQAPEAPAEVVEEPMPEVVP